MSILLKKISESASMPYKASENAAGYDLYAATTDVTVIRPHETVKIGTGIAIAIEGECTFGAIYARSGLATKGLRPANCVGVIDPDYRGEIIVALHNDTDESISIAAQERIAQIVFCPYFPVSFDVVDELPETERGDGGFGSTGTI